MYLIPKFIGGAIGLTAALGMNHRSIRGGYFRGRGYLPPFPIYAKWASAYKGRTRRRAELSVGRLGRRDRADRGQGRTFGASDVPLSVAKLNRYSLLQNFRP